MQTTVIPAILPQTLTNECSNNRIVDKTVEKIDTISKLKIVLEIVNKI